jgi:DNA-binding transcriptional ArsR family regulator
MTQPAQADGSSRRVRLRSPRLTYDIELLRVLGDETRQLILQFLCTPGAGRMMSFSVTQIADNFQLTASTVSHHLQLLRRAQLVTVRREGKERLYSLQLEVLRRGLQQMVDVVNQVDTTMQRQAAAAGDGASP